MRTKKTALDRRKFVKSVSSGALLWTIRAQVTVLALGHDGEARAEKVYDLVMECWSTLGSGRLGEQKEPLKASAIIAGKAMMGIVYTQDEDGHTFDLTAQHMQDLVAGRMVSVITTEAQGHTHEVRIDPKNHANENGIEKPSGPNPPTNPPTNPPGEGGKPADPGSLQAILDQNCTECHHAGSPAPTDMTKPLAPASFDKILERVTSTDPTRQMPPGFRRKLTGTEVEALKKLLK